MAVYGPSNPFGTDPDEENAYIILCLLRCAWNNNSTSVPIKQQEDVTKIKFAYPSMYKYGNL